MHIFIPSTITVTSLSMLQNETIASFYSFVSARSHKCHVTIYPINIFDLNMIYCLIFYLIPVLSLLFTAQILANIIIFMCGNMAGAYHKHLMELALKQTYQDTCNCIKSPIKLEFEKRQQVKWSIKVLMTSESV